MATYGVKNKDMIYEDLGQGAVLINPDLAVGWVLNETAWRIWQWCESLSVEELADKLANLGGQTGAGVKSEVNAALEFLFRKHCLTLVNVGSEFAHPEAFFMSGVYQPPRFREIQLGDGGRRRPSPRGVSGGPG